MLSGKLHDWARQINEQERGPYEIQRLLSIHQQGRNKDLLELAAEYTKRLSNDLESSGDPCNVTVIATTE